MSSIDRAVMLEALGWSRCGEKNKYLPDDIVNIIHQFTFFDVRTETYREHLKKEKIKADKLYVLDQMMFQINDGLKRCETGKYKVEYNSINVGSNCCTVCGEFVPVWDPIPENISCSCRFFTEEEIMELEHERQDNYFWEEEEKEKEEEKRNRERRRKERDFENEIENLDYDTFLLEDDPYSDRKPNWDEGSECSLDDEYCCDDENYYF